jgi:lipoprotein-releasing system ATP-binding protein
MNSLNPESNLTMIENHLICLCAVILELKNVGMRYRSGDSFVRVLDGVDLSVRRGESIGLVGQSGIGKSTLLQIAGLLEKPVSGMVVINGQNAIKLTDDEKTFMRRKHIGFVYQHHNLLQEFTALENVMIPLLISSTPRKEAKSKALKLLDDVGLGHRADHNSKKLSGGEQQRVAIARALVTNPSILIADEPTGNLDPTTAETVFALFTALVDNAGASLLMATHNIEFARKLDRTIKISNYSVQEM